MLVNNRPQNDDKNGEKKVERFAPSSQQDEPQRSSPDGAAAPIGTAAKPPGNGDTDPHGEANHRARRILGAAQKRVQARVHEARQRLSPVGKWVQETARERPFQVIAATSGLGFLVGALMRRLVTAGTIVTLGLLTVYYLSRPRDESTPAGAAAQN
jgi:ElaB/YqjD/DUF883 family membrane-anchored ribosome-binding protein